MLEIGKLYSCEEYYLLLYPDKDTASDSFARVVAGAKSAPADAAYLTSGLRKPVSYLEKSSPLLVLNTEEKFVEVLVGDRKGWIILKDWLNIKEIQASIQLSFYFLPQYC
jgi:hypothetical protein